MSKKRVAPRKYSNSTSKLVIRKFSQKQISDILAKQKDDAKTLRQKKSAESAVKSFRPKKSDYGKMVMIGMKGKRDPQAKGRKGYLVYVNKKGKKELVKGYKNSPEYKPAKITDLNPKISKKYLKAANEFQHARSIEVGRGKIIVKGSGSTKGRGQNDFSQRVVDDMAESLTKTINAQAGYRIFNVNTMALIELPDGETEVFNVQVPIAKQDREAIDKGGIKNFISKKYYAYLAQALAYQGFVSAGSANHIRRLPENNGAMKQTWTQNGEPWRGRDKQIVKIKQLEWKIEQSK